jgi:hypothetical protein
MKALGKRVVRDRGVIWLIPLGGGVRAKPFMGIRYQIMYRSKKEGENNLNLC